VDGSYQNTAQAVDAVNSTHTDSENATYVVFMDTTPPTVSITNPINGTTVSGTVNIQVSASDSLSGVNPRWESQENRYCGSIRLLMEFEEGSKWDTHNYCKRL